MDKQLPGMDLELRVKIDEESYKVAEERLIKLDPVFLADRRSFWYGLAVGIVVTVISFWIALGVLHG